MENRFSVKDLFLFLMLGVLMVMVALAMIQFDRQYQLIHQTNEKVKEQTEELAYLKQRMMAGGGIGGGGAQANLDADLRVRRNHANPDYLPGGTVVDVLASVPNRLTPILDGDLYGARIQTYVFDYLAERDPVTLEWEHRLAKSWTISPDGLTIDFELRPGVVFSNGDPLTADDVKFTMDLTMNEKIEAPGARTYLDKLARVEKTSELGIRYVFKEPYYRSFETAASTQVLSKKFYSKYTPEQFNTSPGLMMGAGPYRMPDPTAWKPEPGKPIELVRNERYWGEPPGPDRLVWRLIELPPNRMTALRNGEIDVYGDMNAIQFDEMTKDAELSKRVRGLPMQSINYGYMFVAWNQKRNGKPTAFADVRVRRAMTMLIDRESIIRNIYRGFATPISGPFHPKSPMSDPSVHPLSFDPAQAEKLLAEAGYVRQGGGLVGPDRQPFRFELLYTSNSDSGKRTATFIQDAMARVGIICNLTVIEWNVLEQRQKERQYDALMMGWGGGGVEDDPTQMYSSEAAKGVGQNFVQNINPKLDQALEAARTTLDDAKRMKLWHVVHKIIHDDQPYTFVAADWELVAVAARFKGAEETKLGLTPRTEWYVPKGTPRR
jgi:peptide/nickel transport system substrate-binding protein